MEYVILMLIWIALYIENTKERNGIFNFFSIWLSIELIKQSDYWGDLILSNIYIMDFLGKMLLSEIWFTLTAGVARPSKHPERLKCQ